MASGHQFNLSLSTLQTMEVISPSGKSSRKAHLEYEEAADTRIKRRRKSKTRISWGDLCAEVRTKTFARLLQSL